MKEGRDGACWAWHDINVDGGLVNVTDDADVGLLTGWREVGVSLDEVVALGAVGGMEGKGLVLYLDISGGEVCAAAECSGFYEGGVSEISGWGW